MLARWSAHAALPLRLALGVIFLVHGAQKLFGVFGGHGLAGTADYFAGLGLVPGMVWATVIGLVELLGGAALILGVLTRWAALGVEMLVALLWVHLPSGFMAAQGGIEFPLALLGGLVSLLLSGPQAYAVDAYLPATVTLSAPAEPQRKAA